MSRIKTPAEKIVTAKMKLLTNNPFFAMLAFPMSFIEAPWCGTMATDGEDIYYSPEFVDKMDMEETQGVIMHEVLHAAFLHPFRLKGRNHKIWNIACDVIINQMVRDSGGKLPAGGVEGAMFNKYKDWIVDDVYNDLMKNAKEMPQYSFPSPNGKDGDDQEGDGGKGKDGKGDQNEVPGGMIEPKGKDGKALSQSEQREREEEMKTRVKQAAQSAKSRGKLPGSLSGLIEAAGKNKINWRDYLMSLLKGITPDNYSWVRPNRKMFVNHGIYMPRMQFNGCGVGVLSIDTSGSVSDQELVAYITEIVGIIEMCKPEKLYIIQHDAIVQKVDVWEGEDFRNLKIKGRGGTCIAPVFKHIQSLEEEINWMVAFSDMYIGDFPKNPPDFPVFWCATGPTKPPFGDYIPIRENMQG